MNEKNTRCCETSDGLRWFKTAVCIILLLLAAAIIVGKFFNFTWASDDDNKRHSEPAPEVISLTHIFCFPQAVFT